MKQIIAIDPGSKGFVTFWNEQDGYYCYYSIADEDMPTIARHLEIIRYEHPDVRCVMEEVHAIYGSSAKSTFSFGEINGYLKGILTTLQIPYTLIQPKQWQSDIWINQDKVYDTKPTKDGESRRVINTKKTSYNAAKRLFPAIDLRKTTKCKNFDDNKVDSLLLCEYARRHNL